MDTIIFHIVPVYLTVALILPDKRMDGWPLMDNPLWTVTICLIYYYFVKVWGPRFMEKRPPFELRGLMMIYNVLQVLFNGWMFLEAGLVAGAWFYNLNNILCRPIDYSDNPLGYRTLRVGYCFFISKFIDLIDTIFFVLRKKYNQITFLHLSHHGLVPIITCFGIRFLNGGNTHFCGLINAFVHVVMYSYYLLSAMGPRIQTFVSKWKRYVTVLQIVQFVAVSAHSFTLFFIECDFPVAFAYWIGCTEIFFLVLFLNFFRKTYTKKKDFEVNESGNNNQTKTFDSNIKIKKIN